MPNQPKTPARTFRVSDEHLAKLNEIQASINALSRSDALRHTIDAFDALSAAFPSGPVADRFDRALTEGIPEGLPLEALAAADEAARLNGVLPEGEADRRLIAALVAAQPHFESHATEQAWIEVDRIIRQHSHQVAFDIIRSKAASVAESAS